MAKRKLNKRVVLAMSVAASVLMVVAAIVMLKALEKTDPAYFVVLAEEARDAENWEQAELYYHRAWQRTRDVQYQVLRGEVALESGNVAGALRSWRDAAVADPERLDAQTKLVGLQLELARIQGGVRVWLSVKDAAEKLLKVGTEAAKEIEALARHARGMALSNLASQDESFPAQGLAELEAALAIDPQNVDIAIDLARRYAVLDRRDEGLSLLRGLFETYSEPGADASRLRCATAMMVAADGSLDEARPVFEEATQLAGNDLESQTLAKTELARFVMQAWAKAKREGGDDAQVEALFGEALGLLQEAADNDPDSFEPPLQLSLLYAAVGEHRKIIETCEARLQRSFSRRGIDAAKNRLYVFTLNLRAAQACTTLAQLSEDPDARQHELAAARQYIADANGEILDHPLSLAQEGRILIVERRDREALEALRTAHERNRNAGRLDLLTVKDLATLHLKLEEPGAAKTVLDDARRAVASRPQSDLGFWCLYGRAQLGTGQAAGALLTSSRILEIDPAQTCAQTLRAAARAAKGQFGLAAGDETGARRALFQAKDAVLQGDLDGAIQTLREALEVEPTKVELLSSYVGLLLNQDRLDEAREVVQRALAIDPDSTEINALAVATRTDLSPEERDREFRAIIERQEDGYQRNLDLIAFHVRRDESAEALPFVNEALELLLSKGTPLAQRASTSHLRALLSEKLRLGVILNDDESVKAAIDSAVAQDADGAGGQSLIGLHHMYKRSYRQAVAAFQAAIALQPTDARLLAHLGFCLMQTGESAQAREVLDRAVRINPREVFAHKGLGILAQRRGDDAALARHLRVCRRSIPNDRWVQATLSAQRDKDDPAGAIAQREAQLEENPDDADNLYRLALLCENENRREEADQYFERLLDVLPDRQRAVRILSQYFNRTDRPERSLAVSKDYVASRSTAAEQADAQLLVARHYLELQQFDDVEAALLAAADMAVTPRVAQSLGDFYLRDRRRPDEAIRWYDNAVTLAAKAQSPLLPQLLATRIYCLLDRGLNDMDRASSLTDELLSQYPNDARGLLLRSEIHARRGEIEEAVAALTRRITTAPGDPVSFLRRAEHYVALGRIPAAIEDLESVKRIDPLALDLGPRLLLAKLFHASGRDDQWVGELESLTGDAPDDPKAIEALCRAYASVDRLDDADRLLSTLINRAGSPNTGDPNTGDPNLGGSNLARWFMLRGAVSHELGEIDRSLQDYRRAATLDGFSDESVAAVLSEYLHAKRYADGVSYYTSTTPAKPFGARVRSRHAMLLARSGQADAAVVEFLGAVERAIDEGTASVGAVAQDVVRAFGVAEAVRRFESGGTKQARARDRVMLRLLPLVDRFAEAATQVDRMIGTASDDAERAQLFEEKGAMHDQAGQYDIARKAYEESLRYDDGQWIVLNNLAYLLSDKLGEHEQARPYALAAVVVAETPDTLDTLGWIYVGLSDYRRGIAELNRAVRLGGESAESFYHLGEAYRRDRQFDEASTILQQAEHLVKSRPQDALTERIAASREKIDARNPAP